MKTNSFFWFGFSLFLSLTVQSQITNNYSFYNHLSLQKSYSRSSNSFTAFKSSFSPNDSIKNGKLTLFSHQKNTFQLVVNPAFNTLLGYQNKERNNMIDYSFGGDVIGRFKRLNWRFTYLNINNRPMQYQNDFILKNRVLPGLGVTSGINTFQTNFFSSFLNYNLNQFFDFELGYGRNFIGDGYRSLLLSDYSNASPYLKITTSFWKLQYTNLFASHQNIYNVEGVPSLYEKKYTATHFLDWKATKWLSISLFETIIWQAEENNYRRGFDVNYLNPVIFYRPVEFSVGSSDNAMVGTNLKITPIKNFVFYSQLIFDEFLLEELRADVNQTINPNQDIKSGWWANKYGLQFGLRTFDFLKINGLQTRIEFNLVRPYTYAHTSPIQSYSNYNLSLAHPLGANFHEFVSIINYQKNNWFAKLQYNQSRKGTSPKGTNMGDNILLSNTSRQKEYENTLTQGVPVFTQFVNASFGYVIDQNTSTTFSVNIIWREQVVGEVSQVNSSVFFNLKTNLYNQYWDH